MSLLTPDLTGTNPLCKVENDTRLIVVQDQVVEFHDSIYADSLEIVLIGTVTKPLIRDYDWTITDSDIDNEAIGAMRLREPDFRKTLIKSITMIKTYAGDYKISMAYQRLYAVPSSVALENYPNKVEFTPEAWNEVVQRVKKYELLLAPIKDINADGVIKQPKLLEPDPFQERSENNIVDEIYTVDVPNSVAIIHPICGAFFKDTLVVKYSGSGQEEILVEGTDYKVYGYDSYKTANTPNNSGVYKFIAIISPIVGDVSISYHAYGGDPTLYDIKANTESIENIEYYIKNAELLTGETVGNAPVIINIINKLTALEEEMRRLANQGRPNYGDVTNGTSLLKKITSVDSDLHWWTIAELYKVSGSDQVFIADTMKINVSMLNSKFMFTTYISVNIDSAVDKFKVTCPMSLTPLGYIPYEDYSGLETIIRPQFRIIWNQNAVQSSGIYLQIGMQLKDMVTETICVEDVSGAESCWKLIGSVDDAVLPEDDLITLPSKNHIWSVDNPDSRAETYLIPLIDGTIIWAGTESLNRPNSGSKNLTLVHFLDKEIDISNVRRMRLDLDEVGATKFPVWLDFNPKSKGVNKNDDLVSSAAYYYNGKPAYISGRLRRNPVSQDIELTIGADITAGLASNQLDLKHVIIYT